MNNLLLFAKSPLLGVVKTRLLSSDSPLNEDEVLSLYSAFLKDTLRAALLSHAHTVHLACYPASSMGHMELFLKDSGYGKELSQGRINLFPQEGATFEERVTASANKVLSFSDLLVIIGSDTPTLRPELLDTSFAELRQQKGGAMVLGPSGEGGVYLIGIKSKGALDFTNIFSSGCELENLADFAKSRSLRLKLLEELTDIDVQGDLLTVRAFLSALKISQSTGNEVYFPHNTFEQIREAGWSVRRDNGDTRNKRLVLNFDKKSRSI